MLYNLFTQGYLFTAVLLCFLYCFHQQKRKHYYAMAKTANRLIGVFIFIMLLLVFYIVITFYIIGFPALFDVSLTLAIPFVIAFVALLVNKVRDKAIWILLPVAVLINLPYILNVWIAGSEPFFSSVIERYTSPVVSFMLYGLAFFIIIVMLIEYATSTKKQVEKQKALCRTGCNSTIII